MDEINNPFSPGAGNPPPALTGRDELLRKIKILVARVKNGKAEKSILMVGLRGVGKTVLLNHFQEIVNDLDCKSFLVEAHEDKSLAELLIPNLRKLILSLNHAEKLSLKAKRSLSVFKSFLNGIKLKSNDIEFGFDFDINPEIGAADSGDLENDLPELFLAVAEAAQDRKTCVVILIDEVQYLKPKELSAIIMAMHKMAQKNLPLILIGGGLPILPGLAGESKSYAERLFDFPQLGPLEQQDAFDAIQKPIRETGADISDQALEKIFSMTEGYPYFLQEWGYQTWNFCQSNRIELSDVESCTDKIFARLDANFFRVRFDRLTPREQEYLRALAELGHEPQRSGTIAKLIGKSVNDAAPLRDGLIKKGMIYSPAHGDTAFTVPLFDLFMKRTMPEFNTLNALAKKKKSK